MYLRVPHDTCIGRGCESCDFGFVWRSTYAEGCGEQGDDFSDLNDFDDGADH